MNAQSSPDTQRNQSIHPYYGTSARRAGRETAVSALIVFGFAAFLLRALAAHPYIDLDVFHQIALVREALSLGKLPDVDLWAYTPTLPKVIHHEWGTGAVLYTLLVATGWGWSALAALRIALLAAVAGTMYVVARRNGAHPAAMVLLAPVAILLFSIGLSPVRAHLFTFTGIAILLLVMQADRAGSRRWVLPWLFAWLVWLNLHGGFVIGAVFFALYGLERLAGELRCGRSVSGALRRQSLLLAAGFAMGLAVLVNPYGWDYVPYLLDALTMDRLLIGEWAPIWSSAAQPTLQMLFVFTLLVAAYGLTRWRSVNLPGLPLVLAATWFAVQHQRMVPIFALVWFAFVPAWISTMPLGTLLQAAARRIGVAVAALALVAGCIGLWMAVEERFWEVRLPSPRDGHAWTAPAGAVSYLRETGFKGNLMTPFAEGAYVMWELYPAVRIGMDSRYEAAYPTGALEQNVTIYSAHAGWERLLASGGADAVLVPVAEPLDRHLALSTGWSAVYRDSGHAVFARRPATK